MGTSEQFPVRVRGGVVHPLPEFDEAGSVGAIEIIGGDPSGDYCNNSDRDDEETFGHRARLYRLSKSYNTLAIFIRINIIKIV